MRTKQPSTLFYLVLMGMELTYLYLLGALLGGPAYTLILSLLLYPVALISKVGLPRTGLPHRMRYSLEFALVVSLILVVVGERLFSSLVIGQPDVLGIVLGMGFCGFTWLLGYSVPREQVNYSTIAFRLQVGFLAVLILAQVSGSTPLVFLFFLLVSLALFLARWASSSSHNATVLRSPNSGHLLLAGAGLMVPGIALILVFSPGVAHSIVDWLKNIFLGVSNWMEGQHEAATNPSGDFKFGFGCMRPEQAAPPDQSFLPPAMPASPPEGAAGISPVVIWIIVFAIFVAMVILIAFALRRRRARRRTRPEEPVRFQIRMISLSIICRLISFFPQLFKKLWLWLKLHFHKWRRRPKPSDEPLISMRALYRNLLRWAAREGAARMPCQTPLEHLVLLEQRFPQQRGDLRLLTESYLLARYSGKEVSQDEFDRARQAWQRIVAHNIRWRFSI